jgi:hypothetical protein
VDDLRPDLVVVANNSYPSPEMKQHQVPALAEQLELLRPLADRVVMIGNSPELPRAPGTCVSSRGASLGDCLQSADAEPTRGQGEFRSTVQSLGMTFVDVRPWFCVAGRCPAVIGNVIPLRDREHVTVEYSQQLAEPIARALGLRPGP